MDQTNIVVKSVKPLELPMIQIITNEGKQYTTNLSQFKKVVCFPKNQIEWNQTSITAEGHNITWSCRFEINVLQAIDHAENIEDIKLHA